MILNQHGSLWNVVVNPEKLILTDGATYKLTKSIPNFQSPIAGYLDLVIPAHSNQKTWGVRPGCKTLCLFTWKYKWLIQMGLLNKKHYLLTMCAVVWKASSTIFPSWSDAAWWKTAKIFFHPERMLPAWEFTIWAIQRITMSRIVGDLKNQEQMESETFTNGTIHSSMLAQVPGPLPFTWQSDPHQVTSLSRTNAS